MADADAKQQNPQKLTDEQITVNKLARRSFLAATGALLAGAVAVASGARAFVQQQDPDKQKDPDKKTDPDKKKSDPDKKKDPDKPKIPDAKGTRF